MHVFLVRESLKTLFIDIEISTIDGFQGREKEAIIISTVHLNENNEVGFLSDSVIVIESQFRIDSTRKTSWL